MGSESPRDGTITADQYDDGVYDYRRYWTERGYEHRAEVLALRSWLGGNHYRKAVDVGGGYGRLTTVLTEYADTVTLAEPSRQQLDAAADFLADYPTITRARLQSDALGFPDGSIDLVTMVRVMHHIPDPTATFAELARVLRPGGTLLLEVANLANALNRVRYLRAGQRVPRTPVDIRSPEHIGTDAAGRDQVAFVNHNPATVRAQLERAGFRVDGQLSVSNLRSERLKRRVGEDRLVALETHLQRPLASIAFGPSLFLRATRI